MDAPLLTIAIPTYNREFFLQTCLNALLSQIDSNDERIEIIISDNASTDSTRKVALSFAGQRPIIRYYRNSENVGAEGNMVECYKKATGKYLWVFSDDDILLPGFYKKIIHTLERSNEGNIFLNNFWYDNNLELPLANDKPLTIIKYTDPVQFMEKIHYWCTFTTSNIVNIEVLKNKTDLFKYLGTSLAPLGWIIPSIFSVKENIYVEDRALACKMNNTGGYKLYTVFGRNFNLILDGLIKGGIDNRIKPIINNHLLSTFFPDFLVRRNALFKKEKHFLSLFSVYWRYYKFWRIIVPLLIKRRLGLVKIHQ